MRLEFSRCVVTAIFASLFAASDAHAQSVVPGPGATGTRATTLNNASATPPQQTLGQLIGFICPPGNLLSSDLQARCNDIVRAVVLDRNNAGAQAALQAMAPEENSAVQTVGVDANEQQDENVRDRLEHCRQRLLNGKDEAAPQDGLSEDAGACAEDAGDSRWGLYLNGNFGIGDKDSTARETGFSMNSYGVTGGADYRLTDASLLGMSLGYTGQNVDLDSNSGKLDTDAVAVSIYGSYYPSAASYVNVIGMYTVTGHDQERNIVYSIAGRPSNVNQKAISDTVSDEIAGSVEAGYDFQRAQWTLTPYARIDIAHTEIDGYSERMSNPNAQGSGLAMQIDDQDFTSLTTAFGARAASSIMMERFDLFPQVGIEYLHEFENDNEDTTGRFVDDRSRSTFLLPTDAPDRNYANVSAGLSADFRNGWSGHFAYQGLLGYKDLQVHVFEIGVRLQY
ncbi:MAG: autotransporter outer membrane beta-barrel domain-containing protein [Gammaproteobacteria bacterium]